MRGVLDIFNKWWNVLGRQKSSYLPYTFIKTPDITWIDFAGGDVEATLGVYKDGVLFWSLTTPAILVRHQLINNQIPDGTVVTLTDRSADGKVKYLKVGNNVIFDIR